MAGKKPVEKKKTEKKASKQVIPKTVQQAMPLADAYGNGIVKLDEKHYSKLYAFEDMNFIVEPDEKQERILGDYEKLLNHFPENVSLTFCIVNEKVSKDELMENFYFQPKRDNYDQYRDAYNELIDVKIAEGRNDIRKKRYVLVTVTARTYEDARDLFNTIDNELNLAIKDINRTGVRQVSMLERAEIMNKISQGLGKLTFKERYGKYFDESTGELFTKDLKKSGKTFKDLTAPMVIAKAGKGHSMIQLDEERYCKSFLLMDFPQQLDTKFLTDITDIPAEMVTTVTFTPEPRKKSLRRVKERNNSIKADILKASKSALQNGYDPEYTLSESLMEAREEARQLRKSVVTEGKRLFFATIVSSIFGNDEKEVNEHQTMFYGKCSDYSIVPNNLIGQQIAGFKVSLLTGFRDLNRDIMLTSESSLALFPFKILELQDSNGTFFGINPISKNMIMYNRRTSPLPNGFVLGKSGSGKSFIAKGEISSAILNSDDDIIILDPDNEYRPLADEFGGTVIDLDRKSTFFINPCDMNMEFDDPKADPLTEKCDYMVGLVESILGESRECTPYEVNAIHKATKAMYEEYMTKMEERHNKGEKDVNGNPIEIDTTQCPTLVDFFNILSNDNSPEAGRLCMMIEPYCIGQYDLFAHRTNITGEPRFIVYNLKNLPQKMKEFAMKVCMTNMWTKVCANKEKKRATRIYIDEFYLICKTEASASTLQTYFKRIRKYFGIMTGITQDITELLITQAGIGMLENSGFLLIMNQSPTGRDTIAHRYNVPDSLIDFINEKDVGNGLIYTGRSMIPFDYHIPSNNKLYRLWNTKAGD